MLLATYKKAYNYFKNPLKKRLRNYLYKNVCFTTVVRCLSALLETALLLKGKLGQKKDKLQEDGCIAYV